MYQKTITCSTLGSPELHWPRSRFADDPVGWSEVGGVGGGQRGARLQRAATDVQRFGLGPSQLGPSPDPRVVGMPWETGRPFRGPKSSICVV